MPILLRRRNLGRTSCREIKHLSQSNFQIVKTWKQEVPRNVDVVFRWGCTTNLPDGATVVNSAEAIHRVTDKTGFRRILNEHGLCPKTYFSVEEALRSPRIDFVVRPRVHSRGRRIYRCRTPEELREAVEICGPGYYISDYVAKVSEYRVFVVQGRAVWVAKKTPSNPNDLAWNVARGGRFDNVHWDDWPLKVVKTAIKAHDLTQLDFSGIDVMSDREGNCFVLEANSAPSQTSPYRQACTAKAFDYICGDLDIKKIPLIDAKGGWKKFIHPAISQEAILRVGP